MQMSSIFVQMLLHFPQIFWAHTASESCRYSRKSCATFSLSEPVGVLSVSIGTFTLCELTQIFNNNHMLLVHNTSQTIGKTTLNWIFDQKLSPKFFQFNIKFLLRRFTIDCIHNHFIKLFTKLIVPTLFYFNLLLFLEKLVDLFWAGTVWQNLENDRYFSARLDSFWQVRFSSAKNFMILNSWIITKFRIVCNQGLCINRSIVLIIEKNTFF